MKITDFNKLPSPAANDVIVGVDVSEDITKKIEVQDLPISNATQTALDAKQDNLVSGVDIKTVNSESLLGSGDISFASKKEYFYQINSERTNTPGVGEYFAFGNGANNSYGAPIHVPTGFKCYLIGLGISQGNGAGNAKGSVSINRVPLYSQAEVLCAGYTGINSSFTPIELFNGDQMGFFLSVSGTITVPVVMTGYLKFIEQ